MGARGARVPCGGLGAALLLGAAAVAPAADVRKPADVERLRADKAAPDVRLSWDAVTRDRFGNPETVDRYEIYRGTSPDFVPDREGKTNRVGTATATSFLDPGALDDGLDHYYLVSAVDPAGNEGNTKPSTVVTPPVLGGWWTATTIELDWTEAQPASEVATYLVYYGRASGQYEFVDDVGSATHHSLSGLEPNVNWYAVVVAVDWQGNESAPSNEHVDAVGGKIDRLVMDDVQVCNGCTAQGDEIVRRNGHEKLLLAELPEGDWKSVTLAFTVDSRLCGASNQCDGSGPCGDPWDRTATVFLVLDDCVEQGVACSFRNDNLELLRTITPFGTDADTGPRTWTFDVTPFASLLVGRRYIGVHISTWVSTGWWVDVQLHFSEDPAEASPEPPAAGIQPVFYHDGGNIGSTRPVSVPASATSVKMRLFTTGHGANPPSNCDEFCQKTNRILVDGSPVWEDIPWRECCFPLFPGDPFCRGCTDYNACGFPSCTFDRSGWCPGLVACHDDDPCDQDLEATGWLPPGGTYEVGYEIVGINGSWSKSLVVYWYE